MERDKRGRFIKRMQTGGTPEWLTKTYTKNGKSYRIFENMYNTLKNDNFNDNLIQQLFDETYKDSRSYMSFKNVFKEISPEVTSSNTTQSSNQNTTNNNQTETTTTGDTQSNQEQSAGFNPIDNTYENNILKPINKTKLSDYLEITKAGIGLGINNKIADRALEVEKPYLQNPVEHYRTVYGDYRAQKQGEQAAAQLRQTVSQPLTSDGAVQTNAMLTAQLKGQEFINEGNAQDDNLIKQTREIAWQQEKENRNLRHAVAEENRKTLLQTQKNKSTIENMRDSANYSQIIDPLLSAKEQRLRQQAKQQEQAEEAYNEAIITNDVWNTYTNGLSALELEAKNAYLTGGNTGVNTWIGEDVTKKEAWLSLQKALKNEIIRRQAQLQEVYINPTNYTSNSSKYGLFANSNPLGFKQGGTIYKARLTKRTKDNDRTAKSTEISKKIAAKFLEKALDSLYTYKDVELIARPVKKKKKYQAGGGLPFVGFTPVFATSETGVPAQQAKTESEKKGEDLTTKDILELLKDMDGLPADMDVITANLMNFVLLDESDPLGISASSNIASRYLNVINQIKKAKTTRDWYDKVYDELRKNGALNELVVNSAGQFLGLDEQYNAKYFTAEQINKGQLGDFQLLTNGNLLQIRAKNPDFAFDSSFIMEAADGISIPQVTEYIKNTISSLGSTTQETKVFGNQQATVLAGLQQLQEAAKQTGQDLSISDMYEARILNESQAQQATFAINYLWNTLPANMKALLTVKGGSEKGALDFVTSLVNSTLDQKQIISFSPKSTRKEQSDKKNEDDLNIKLSLAQYLQMGYGEDSEIVIQDRSNTGLAVHAVSLPLSTKGNTAEKPSTLADVFGSEYSGALKLNQASIGGIPIDYEVSQYIAIDPSQIASIEVPIDLLEAEKGRIIPDLSLIDKVNEANKYIKQNNINSAKAINEVYQSLGLPVYLDERTGKVLPQYYQRFAVINGTFADGAVTEDRDIFKGNHWLKPIENTSTIRGTMAIINKGLSKDAQYEFDDSFVGKSDTLYQGTIFIPIASDLFAGSAGSGNTYTSNEAAQIEAIQESKIRRASYINAGDL